MIWRVWQAAKLRLDNLRAQTVERLHLGEPEPKGLRPVHQHSWRMVEVLGRSGASHSSSPQVVLSEVTATTGHPSGIWAAVVEQLEHQLVHIEHHR